MKTLLIKNVKHLVTCDTDDRVLNGVNVLVQDGIIVRIGQEDMTADDVIDASHMVMYPGLINTHHHLSDIQSEFTSGTEHGAVSMAENFIRNMEKCKRERSILQLSYRYGRTAKKWLYYLSGSPLCIPKGP